MKDFCLPQICQAHVKCQIYFVATRNHKCKNEQKYSHESMPGRDCGTRGQEQHIMLNETCKGENWAFIRNTIFILLPNKIKQV